MRNIHNDNTYIYKTYFLEWYGDTSDFSFQLLDENECVVIALGLHRSVECLFFVGSEGCFKIQWNTVKQL